MTMTDARVTRLGEFPPPPPCPKWCKTDHEVRDYKKLVTWSRPHESNNGPLALQVGDTHVYARMFVYDEFWAGRWHDRKPVEVGLQVGDETIYASTDNDLRGLMAVAGLLSPEILASVQSAVWLACSPEVTPTGEDQ